MRHNNRKHLETYYATGNTPVAYFPLRSFIEKYANEDEPAISIGCGLGFECVAMYQAGRSYVVGIDKNSRSLVDACNHPKINYYQAKACESNERFYNSLHMETLYNRYVTLAVLRHMDKVLDGFTTRYIAGILHYYKVKKIILEVTPTKYGHHEKATLLFAHVNYLLYYKVVKIENNFMLLELKP